jgi:hypothetical protein
MATVWTVKAVSRPVVDTEGAGGESGPREPFAGLEAIIDRKGVESGGMVLRLPFADTSGLETEWTAGTDNAVLKAAIAALLAGKALGSTDTGTAGGQAMPGYELTV